MVYSHNEAAMRIADADLDALVSSSTRYTSLELETTRTPVADCILECALDFRFYNVVHDGNAKSAGMAPLEDTPSAPDVSSKTPFDMVSEMDDGSANSTTPSLIHESCEAQYDSPKMHDDESNFEKSESTSEEHAPSCIQNSHFESDIPSHDDDDDDDYGTETGAITSLGGSDISSKSRDESNSETVDNTWETNTIWSALDLASETESEYSIFEPVDLKEYQQEVFKQEREIKFELARLNGKMRRIEEVKQRRITQLKQDIENSKIQMEMEKLQTDSQEYRKTTPRLVQHYWASVHAEPSSQPLFSVPVLVKPRNGGKAGSDGSSFMAILSIHRSASGLNLPLQMTQEFAAGSGSRRHILQTMRSSASLRGYASRRMG